MFIFQKQITTCVVENDQIFSRDRYKVKVVPIINLR